MQTPVQTLQTASETADVLIYDGQCAFCRAAVRLLQRFDWTGRLTLMAAPDERIAQRWPDLTAEELSRHMVVVGARGQRWKGAAGVRRLSRRLPALWWMAPVLHMPGSLPLWRWLYRQVARRRYRWGGAECESGRCTIG